MEIIQRSIIVFLMSFVIFGCNVNDEFDIKKQAFGMADKCYNLKFENKYMVADHSSQTQELTGYSFSEIHDNPANMFVTATDLGRYLIFGDESRHYFQAGNKVNEGHNIDYVTSLTSEVTMPNQNEEHMLLSPAEWMLERSDVANEYHLYNLTTDQWLIINEAGEIGLNPIKNNSEHSSTIKLEGVSSDYCKHFPESELNVTGEVTTTTWPNGDLWGIADIHEHLMPGFTGTENFMHGTPFHKLGIEHALSDSEKHHGKGGSRDILVYPGIVDITEEFDFDAMLESIANSTYQYDTKGYPDFTYWPAFDSASHHATYYKWIERAYLGGVRIMTEYIEAGDVFCRVINAVVPMPFEGKDCEEMSNVDRGIERLNHMERYIDAKNGGKGKGWFKIVYSASEAREVIASGKLAVIIGLEIENPFNCNRRGIFSCSESYVQAQLDKYYDKGIRAIFPSHKLNNAFTTGDGSVGFLELVDFLNGGVFRDYASCDKTQSEELASFESHKTNSIFTINKPSDASDPGFIITNAVIKIFNIVNNKSEHSQAGVNYVDIVVPLYPWSEHGHCEQQGLSKLGKSFVKMLMKKGMIIDSSHYGTNALAQAFEMHEKYNYPPIMTHGNNYAGKLLDLGGIQSTSFISNCVGDEIPISLDHMVFTENYKTVKAHPTAYKALSIANDFNGLAPLPKPRFGDNAQCKNAQNPATMVKYPFTTYGGDFVMDKQVTGNRVFDVNTDGLATIGLLPDLIEQERLKGLTEDMLKTLYRGAEGFVRAWEKMERQSSTID